MPVRSLGYACLSCAIIAVGGNVLNNLLEHTVAAAGSGSGAHTPAAASEQQYHESLSVGHRLLLAFLYWINFRLLWRFFGLAMVRVPDTTTRDCAALRTYVRTGAV